MGWPTGRARDELLTVGDAAEILGLSVGMVRVLNANGQLACVRTPKGYRLFRRGDVERLARARAKGGEGSG
jgi:excisionase family DNA binding protein